MASAGGAVGTLFQGVGVAGGIATGIKSGNAQEDIAKDMIRMQKQLHEEGAAERKRVSDMTRADQDIARQNLLASEQARLNVLSSLGTPGSFGPSPGSTAGPLSLGVLKPTGLSAMGPGGPSGGLLSQTSTKSGRVAGKDVALGQKAKWKGEKYWEVEGAELDPDAMAAQVQGTSSFRTVSKMVAEAEQIMNRQGPLWEELNNSVVGSIYQSNNAFNRQAMDEMSRAMARGGSARRQGLQMAQAFQVQEQVNRTRTGQLWQAKMGLEEYRTKYAQDVTSYAQNWVNNASGIRDTFTSSLQQLQMYWSSTLAPALVGATTQAQSTTSQGILNASQGLYDAVKTRTAAVQGAFQALASMGDSMGGYMGNMGSGDAAQGLYNSAGQNAPPAAGQQASGGGGMGGGLSQLMNSIMGGGGGGGGMGASGYSDLLGKMGGSMGGM